MEMTLPAWTTIFLSEYTLHGLKATAAKTAGTTIAAVDKLMLDCIEFETAVSEAEELAADNIEREAYRRAVKGVQKGVYYKGIRMDTERVYSDTLMVKMLEAKRRRQFGNKTEITGAGGGPLQIVWRTFDQPNLGDVTIVDSPNGADARNPSVIDAEFRSFPTPADPPRTAYKPTQQEIEDAHSLV